jgi:hypothetical protein
MNQHRMMDEHRNFGTIFYSRDCDSNNMVLYDDSCGGGDGQEDNVATPEVHQRGGDAQHFFNFKDLRNQHVAPIARGANVQSVCKAMCQLKIVRLASGSEMNNSSGCEDYVDVENENRTVECGEDLARCLQWTMSYTCPPLT